MSDYYRLAESALGFTDRVEDAYEYLVKAGAPDDEIVACIFTAIETLRRPSPRSDMLRTVARRDELQVEEVRVMHPHALDMLGWPTLGSKAS